MTESLGRSFESFGLETLYFFIDFSRSKRDSSVEDDDSHAFAVLLHVSFAHRVLQDIMPGKKREVGGGMSGKENGNA